ncbi:unnamed protein product [Mytilus coruscus]|uniref:Uncharacterized protein n=1 Tax=Mytilus coruscus TaxID=42192 RepID=A0A6J8DR55_MYTCO|nr:unnamed protein product [Mytilus coruscus]
MTVVTEMHEKENELVVTPRTLRKRNIRNTEMKEPGTEDGENSSQISDNGANESYQAIPSITDGTNRDEEELLLTEKSLSVSKEEEKLLTQKSSEKPNKESPSHTKLTKTEILASKKSTDVSVLAEKPSPKKSSGVSTKDVKLLEKLLDVSPKKDTLLTVSRISKTS